MKFFSALVFVKISTFFAIFNLFFQIERRVVFGLSSLKDDASKKPFRDSDCPVCIRILRAVQDLSKSQSISNQQALKRYCNVPNLETEDMKFCYNIDPIQQELNRLFQLGADEFRICKKIKSINSDFCLTKEPKKNSGHIHLNKRLQRGIIYI